MYREILCNDELRVKAVRSLDGIRKKYVQVLDLSIILPLDVVGSSRWLDRHSTVSIIAFVPSFNVRK